MGSVLVPKGPRAEAQMRAGGGSVVARSDPNDSSITLRAQLFAVPLPPAPTSNRPYPTHTALGRIMRLRGLTVNEVAKVPGGPSSRMLTEILAGRRDLHPEWKDALATGLGVDRRLLD